MGAHITFAKAGADHWGHVGPDHGEIVGHAYFSAFTARFQQHAYGLCWHDCLVYVQDGEEMVGPRDKDAGPEEWYQPDWALALDRVRALLKKAEETDNAHRREYDFARLSEFVAAIERCAKDADICYVRFNY